MLSREVVGVLIMAYGTPYTPEEILPYYTHIRRGKPPTPELLEELTSRYQAIGGLSQLNRITGEQAEGTFRALQQFDAAFDYRLYVANKHWRPWIPDTIQQMGRDGIKRAVALVLAPQGSKMSSGAYFDQVEKANAELAHPIAFANVFSWHMEPGFIAAEVEKMEEALTRFPDLPRDQIAVIFSCHSLPQRILEWGDPYPTHLREIGAAVAGRLGLTNVHYAYQSAGRTPEPWLGPDIREKVAEMAATGQKHFVISSVGFISDHLEVLFDLDIEMQQTARELGVSFVRTGMLNDHPLLLRALAGVISRYARGEQQ